MKLWRTPVALFLLAAGLPFAVSFACFVISQRHALLMEPEAYMDLLRRTGSAPHVIRIITWKHVLARDPQCQEADVLIIGSSRVREIDASVVGASTCNLYVDGLRALGLKRLAQDLARVAPGHHPVVYVGIDHFWFFWAETDYTNDFELTLLERSRTLWKVSAVVRVLGFFSITDLTEAVRRYRHGSSADNEWHADGHLFHPRYYARKRAGIHVEFSQSDVERSVNELFGGAHLRESNLRALETAVRVLHGKGYGVRAFWTPVSPAHIASARRHFPGLFQETIDAVDRLAPRLPLDRYLSASKTLDPSQFGCTERDYFDITHIDADCMRRLFDTAFGDVTSPARRLQVSTDVRAPRASP